MLLALNAFLLRPSVRPTAAFSDVSGHSSQYFYWDGNALEQFDWTESDLVAAASPAEVAIVLLDRSRNAPVWQQFLRQALNLSTFGSGGTSFGAVIFCSTPEINDGSRVRWVAWSFGTASRMLSRSVSDPRFGLTIALNLLAAEHTPRNNNVDPSSTARPQFRELRYRTTAPYFQQTGHRAARDIPTEGFRVDRLSDLVAAIGGRTGTATFTKSVLGGRSLRFKKDIGHLGELVDLSGQLLELSTSASYQGTFDWVDNIRLVEDADLIDALHSRLMLHLSSDPVPANVDAILPDDLLDIDSESSIRYILFPRERTQTASRINLTIEMLAQLAVQMGGSDSPRAALETNLRFLDESMEQLGSARLIECVCADLLIDDEQFIAYDGDYYCQRRVKTDPVRTGEI